MTGEAFMPNKVLIVDDEPFNLDLLEQELGDQGYIIETARDGEEAIEKVGSFEPDVILLDYMMPKMSGVEVVKWLKRDERYKSVPVLMVTAKGSQEDKVTGLDAGADDYIVKPFDSVELLARVRCMMRVKELHDSLEEWNQKLEDKVRQQVDEIERMSRMRRYLAPQVAEAILKREGDDPFETHRREITVVFFDLRGFTSFSDSGEPEEDAGGNGAGNTMIESSDGGIVEADTLPPVNAEPEPEPEAAEPPAGAGHTINEVIDVNPPTQEE